MRIQIRAVFVLFALAYGLAAASDGIVIEVAGGKRLSTDRIVEQEMDLAVAWKLLGQPGEIQAESVRVIEIGPAGEDLGTMVSQVDPADQPGKYVVCWRIPGELSPGKTRGFRVALDGKGPPPAPAKPVSGSGDDSNFIVSSGGFEVRYIGGFPYEITVNDVAGKFAWSDKIYDGAEYRLANHRPEEVRLLASGPLRVVCETKSEYRNGHDLPASCPRALYRFTHYAGEPVVRLSGLVTQDFAHQWTSLHFVEIHFDDAPITHYSTDRQGGKFDRSGGFIPGTEWAAVYGEKLLLGVCDSVDPGIYNGGGKHYGSYVRSGVWPMNTLNCGWKCALYFGSGPGDLSSLGKWSAMVSDAPTIKVSLGVLDRQIAELAALAEQQRDKLAHLDGPRWIAAYIRSLIAQNQLRSASAMAARGELNTATDALAEIRTVLGGSPGDIHVSEKGSVLSGTVDGYPFLVNNQVACFWSRSEQGAGLIGIYDRWNHREFLSVVPASASFWQADVKKGAGGKSYTSIGAACKVDVEKGGLKFAWAEPFGVQVKARLTQDEPLVRMRLMASADAAEEGIQRIIFPVVNGIVPITAGASGDVVLNTRAIGDLVQSPLATGASLQIDYPAGMQFTALQGGERGLYFAEEDPEANCKELKWSPDRSAGALSFSIARPVLGWGGPQLVKKYASVGDVAMGPFKGDWYDAAQLYRRWAITAPWCTKGTLHVRGDVPKWISDAAYWTNGGLDDVRGISGEIKKRAFLGSGGVFHAYHYYLSPSQDRLYPEVWPPRLGSEGFKKVIDGLHKKGIRIVLYISGSLWDQDTESYRTQQAADKAQIKTSDGGLSTTVVYGGGTKLGLMCPGSKGWQDKLAEMTTHGVARYGVDGWYFDFLTTGTTDCFNPGHGHPVAGGNYWTKGIRDLYGRLRTDLKATNPDVMMTGENNAEWVIDLLDTQFVSGSTGVKAPIYQAVYHDYSLLYGGGYNQTGPYVQGRWWLMGGQNGWHNVEGAYANPEGSGAEIWRKDGEYYRRLLRCRREFGLPYLAYGRMLRMPRITGDMPTVTCPIQAGYPSYMVSAVEGSCWQAPDGTAGLFFLNYSEEPREFTWTVDLKEGAGWSAGDKVKLSQWTEKEGLKPLEEVNGGKLTRRAKVEGRGIIAMKLEVIRWIE